MARSITYSDFSVGQDHRKSSSTSDPDRLRVLKNAYVTHGKALRKRPGLTLVATLETGTQGLVSGGGKLNTFYPYNATAITHSDTRFLANKLIHTASAAYGSGSLTKIHKGKSFGGYLYVSAEYSNGQTFHYYINTANPNRVSDANCPNSKTFEIQESRVFAATNDVVKFSALDAPTDWTLATVEIGAGHLPVSVNASGSSTPSALGSYDGDLAVFFADGLQLWITDENSTNMAFKKAIDGVGTTKARTPVIFAGDLLFLAKSGFRSLTTQTYTANLQDSDVGSPVDKLVKSEIGAATDPMSIYFSGAGQYWCLFPLPSGHTRVWVYSHSRSSKVSAWSHFEYGFTVSDVANHDGILYLRSGDNVYVVDETDSVFDDAGGQFDVEISFPFFDFGAPGHLKHIIGMDVVVQGSFELKFKYDQNDETRLTAPVTISGDSRPLQQFPIEITSTGIAPVFTNQDGNDAQIDSITFYYEDLGPV